MGKGKDIHDPAPDGKLARLVHEIHPLKSVLGKKFVHESDIQFVTHADLQRVLLQALVADHFFRQRFGVGDHKPVRPRMLELVQHIGPLKYPVAVGQTEVKWLLAGRGKKKALPTGYVFQVIEEIIDFILVRQNKYPGERGTMEKGRRYPYI